MRLVRGRDPYAETAAAELSAQIKAAHQAKLNDVNAKLKDVPFWQRLFGKKEVTELDK